MKKSIRIRTNLPDHAVAILLLAPAMCAALGVHYAPPPLMRLFTSGGMEVFFYNLRVLILTPYFVFFILAIGEGWLSLVPREKAFKRSDHLLFSFFAGSGLLTLCGFLLGMANLLYFGVCFPIFVVVLYIYLLQPASRNCAKAIWDWVSAAQGWGELRPYVIALRAVLAITIAVLILSKGILLELFKDGGLHQYFDYFAETRLLHGIWMDPRHPILYDYLAGRGQGILLFFTAFTNQFVIQISGVVFLAAIAAVARQVMSFMVSAFGQINGRPSLRGLFPDFVMLLVLTSALLDMEPARFHLQTGAFFLFLAWAGCFFLFLEARAHRWLFFAMLPVVLAYPILGGIFYAFAGWILVIVILSLWLTRKSASLRRPFLLLVFGGISAAFSFGLNWAYVGVPDLQPARAFVPLTWEQRFAPWSSKALIYYLDASLGQSVSSSNISFQKITEDALSLFSYPVINIWEAHEPKPSFLWLYPLIMLALGTWLVSGMLRDGSQVRLHPYLHYWLAFNALYILKFLLTSLIKQASLKRMLIFMDVFPILVFFSLALFLFHWVEVWYEKRKSNVRSTKDAMPIVHDKPHPLIILMSVFWGVCLTLGLVNLWVGFWYRSLPIRLILLSIIIVSGTGFFHLSVRVILRRFASLTGREGMIFVVIPIISSVVLAFILYQAAPLSTYIPVSHTIKITALNERSPLSASNTVRLIELKVNGKVVPLESLEQVGTWKRKGDGLQSRGAGDLVYSFSAGWDARIEILFESGSSAGKVRVEFDDMPPVVRSLYSDVKNEALIVLTPSVADNPVAIAYEGLVFTAEFFVLLLCMTLLSALFTLRLVHASTFLLLGLVLACFQFQVNFGFEKVTGGWRYFTGKEGAIPAYGDVVTYGSGSGDRSDVFHCLAIQAAVPGAAQVLNLNGFGAIEPCLFSPLLPRDKIVHHYEAIVITEPYYETLMFGDPQMVYPLYRDLGINFFYVRKEDTNFVNLGYSLALRPENLAKYFDVYAEADDFYILTWRGEGNTPVSPELADQISLWYERSGDRKYNLMNFWRLGHERLTEWEQAQP